MRNNYPDMLFTSFQMDPEEEIWIVRELLLLDEGAHKFLTNCFLLLDPAEIKACRLVCKEWNEFIMDNLWKSKPGRKKLNEKLEHRWILSLLCFFIMLKKA